MASRIGADEATVNNWEKGNTEPSLRFIAPPGPPVLVVASHRPLRPVMGRLEETVGVLPLVDEFLNAADRPDKSS